MLNNQRKTLLRRNNKVQEDKITIAIAFFNFIGRQEAGVEFHNRKGPDE